MGFFLSVDQRSGFKQHLNLSALAWAVVESDMHHFYGHGPSSLSGFLNTVFTNYYQDSKATISFLMVPAREQLDYIFEFPEVKNWVNNPIKEKIYEAVISLRADEFLVAATSYPKGEGRKFRVNQANQMILEDLEDDRYYNNNVGTYLKALYEDYARRPYHEREAIFYRETMEIIREAIDKKLRLKLISRGNKTYLMSPYCLTLDKYSAFNYVVGLMSEIFEQNEAAHELTPRSIRLSHIEEVKILHSQSGRIPEAQRALLETQLTERGPMFASSEKREIIVHLDEEGLALFETHAEHAPKLIRKLDPYHFVFLGTEREVEDFFAIFGYHAKVFGHTPGM